ncbi:hypothetical protein GCM10018793_26090 [Streptomyces sulfonofaciens]|uniref:Uncharacterized protein n=1 Tax=Streptomyces sulfonofaciens TaxID=68272 RepID=A0A919KYP3_9ACTN|nr:hypothetical protein GCM10018793_26090 [Streptomyces sulfonofaciens]
MAGAACGAPAAGARAPAVACAVGTNHRAPSTTAAAVAVNKERRAADTEYRSPCGAGELTVLTDANERGGSQESHGGIESYPPSYGHY